MASVVLLAVAVVGVFVHPARVGAWFVPVLAACASVAVGAVGLDDLGRISDVLWAPLGFLLLAVPVAVLLDRLGFFAAAAGLVDGGRHLHLGLWVLAALVTTVFNLDASVVLLTPLYVRIARRHGLDSMSLAVQPVLLAAFASSALAVSNLTNLIAAEQLGWSTGRFVTTLALPSLAATTIGYVAYRRWLGVEATPLPVHDPVDRQALRRGAPVVVLLLVGFLTGDVIGAPPVAVAAAALVWLFVVVPDRRRLALPVDAAALAFGLAVCAHGAAPHLPLDRVVPDGEGALAAIAAVALGAIGAGLLNNLPALLVLLPELPPDGPVTPGVLIGVNIGPALVLSGALAGLLWRATAIRLGVPVSVRAYHRMAWRIGLPALLAATVVHAAGSALSG